MNKSEEILEILRKGAGLPEGAEIIKVGQGMFSSLAITYKLGNDVTAELNIFNTKEEENIYETTKRGKEVWVNSIYHETSISKALDEIRKLIGLGNFYSNAFEYDKENGWNIKGWTEFRRDEEGEDK